MSNTDNKENKENKGNAIQMAFAALKPYVDIDMPQPIQKEIAGKKYIPYGRFNNYPAFLLGLYENCSTLKAIVDGNVNFVAGDAILFDGLPATEQQADTVINLALDWYIFGYAFPFIRRNPFGEILDVSHLPAEWVRTDKEHQSFWYSEKWNARGSWQSVVYPAFMEDGQSDASVMMIGNGRGTYPAPLWGAAVKDVLIETNIEKFWSNELQNNFLSSLIVNFNNGVPSDEQKAEIEQNMTEKFSGVENAGRMMLSFNESVANRTTVERLGTDNFDTRYQALASRVREQIFVAFKAQPLLFGLTSETNTGFSTTEFGDLFRLYNKVMISPVQDMLKRAFKKIYGRDCLEIQPFTI